MTKQLELNLGDTPYEDTFSKSKREKTTRLGKETVNIVPRLKKQFPFSIECKNQEKYKGIYDVLAQATTHSRMEPLGIIKMNRNKPIVVLDAEYFLQIFFNKDNDKQG